MHYEVVIENPVEEGVVDARFRVRVPDSRWYADFTTCWPTLHQIASFYAAEFCDSGTVSVRAPDGSKALVVRRSARAAGAA
jgi:hypothetical protein